MKLFVAFLVIGAGGFLLYKGVKGTGFRETISKFTGGKL